ncbi:MAG: response regulator transcription factor [Leptolinea sp.]|jgi:DNA-binding response OmpR family regulator|nr:response regulator transcription factor [Leptolinea sp.]
MSTILLVEDTRELARLTMAELESNGYRVAWAEDGEQALRQFPEVHPDLVILDWMLPGIDGLEVLRRIRQNSAVPVLMLTARREETDRVIGLEVGADDYLTKPFGMRELVARVHALLRRSELIQSVLTSDRSGQEGTFTCGPLRLDPAAFSASLNGIPLELTRTEYGLLSLLARNPGRTFSRNYLLETIWGETYINGDRSVDNAILRLRRKLENLGEAIETIWGIGYRFNRP